MGGSFALALKSQYPQLVVTGVGRNMANLQTAINMGVIDHASNDMAASVASADVVLLGVPVGAAQATLKAIAPKLPMHCLVMDVGSTKADIVALAQAELGQLVPNFVAAHPIAGKESAGVAHATATLYQSARVVLTPSANTNTSALALAKQLWADCGAHLHTMAADEHDRVFAAVSHLPHLLAFAYMNAMTDADALAMAGPGFRDFSRIAGSSPEVWRDIFVANKTPVLQQLALFEAALADIKQLLTDDNAQALHTSIAQASERRSNWPFCKP